MSTFEAGRLVPATTHHSRTHLKNPDYWLGYQAGWESKRYSLQPKKTITQLCPVCYNKQIEVTTA